jgi:gluconolactonase
MNLLNTIQHNILIAITVCFLLAGISSLELSSRSKYQNKEAEIIAANAKPKLVSNQFKFTEGPAVDKKGNVFFTDQPNDKIWKYSTDAQLTVFLDKTGRSNGMYFDKKGNLLTAADEKNELWSISPDKKITVLLDNYQ